MQNNSVNNKDVQENTPKSKFAPVVIGELQHLKPGKTSFVMFIVIGLFIVAIYVLPEVFNYFNPDNQLNIDKKSSAEEIIDNNSEYFRINSDSKINIQNLTFNKFKFDSKTNNLLTFIVINNNNIRVNLNSMELYLEIYTLNKDKIAGYLIETSSLLLANSYSDISVIIEEKYLNQIGYIRILNSEKNDYPDVSLNYDSEGFGYITCIQGHSTYTYYFKEERLQKIKDDYAIMRSEDENNYDNLLKIYKLKNETFNRTEGIESTFQVNNDSITFNATIDLSVANYSSLDENYFEKETSPGKINFEMETKDYECN